MALHASIMQLNVLYVEGKKYPQLNPGTVSHGSNNNKEITDMQKYVVSPILQ